MSDAHLDLTFPRVRRHHAGSDRMTAAVAVELHGACPCSTDGAVVWHDRCDRSSTTCAVCNHRVRVRKDGTLAKHAAQYATTCPNSGSEVAR